MSRKACGTQPVDGTEMTAVCATACHFQVSVLELASTGVESEEPAEDSRGD